VCGVETEYGIAFRGSPDGNPVVASSMLVNAYVEHRKVEWDFEDESPGRDARGFAREDASPPEVETHLVNTVLTNGARYYVDHAHPEFSTPECTDALQVVRYDKAGERVLARSMQAAGRLLPPGQEIVVYKNNSDGKGNSYGCHENYLMSRATPFPMIVRYLTPFLVTRQIFTGSGKVGSEGINARHNVAFQLSQRADFFEVEVGLETTFKRPIINTRDEPHADPEKYRRLHVIIGDANMSEVATFLKTGTTALILKMIEDDFISADLSLAEPVAALKAISADPTCRATVALAEGRTVRAVDLQWEFLDWARKYLAEREIDPVTAEVMSRWEQVLAAIETDPMVADRQLDWVAKLRLIEAYRDRRGLSWDDPKLALVDLQYHDVRRDRGLYERLAASGRVERLTTDEEVERAVMDPPEDTRAYFRGRCIGRYPDAIAAASWDSLIMDIGTDTLQRIPMREPLRGTKVHVEALLEEAETAADLVARLQS